ncbi:ABC transporter permease [Halomarina litorea]|uniref:ABC transporter permease n=1 Tax=Halomarina litorea TaxID=2961595 RepID=UPI0020C43CEB|nr:ABC transporter permease [Halomarina sp. BCD28]
MTTSQGTGHATPDLADGLLGRGSVVLAVLVVQTLAFAAAYAVERPTLYALFALASAAALVATPAAGLRGFLACLVGATLAAGVGHLFGSSWLVVAGPVALTAAVGPVVGTGEVWRGVAVATVATAVLALAAWLLGALVLLVVGPVVLAGVVTGVDGEWAGVAASTLGTVLLVALSLPLALFVARQDFAVVVEKALDPAVHQMLYLSVYAPLLAALFTLAFGVPLAYLLARGFPGQSIVETLVDLPLVVPHSVAGLLILFGFGEGGVFPDLPILTAMPGMVLAMAFVSAPFSVNVAREAFETVDDRLEYAARVHGADSAETFRRVTGPLAARGVVTGGLLAWARSVSEFGAVAIVAYNVEFFYPPAGETVTGQHAPVFIYNTFTAGSLAESSAVGFILLAMSVVIFLSVRWVAYDGENAASKAIP